MDLLYLNFLLGFDGQKKEREREKVKRMNNVGFKVI